ncbi:MAG: phage portal protein, partial [Actinobacteria bacterium]|nr:phage portal protein [Actinomycetota bacterium]
GPDKKIAVLNATTDFTPLNMDPLTLQLAQLQNSSNLDIALLFGLPPYMLGVSIPGDTYANVTSRLVEVVEFGLLPYARRIESSLDAEFPRGTNMRINLDSLRRADTTTRYQAYNLAIQGGWMDPDEVRALENLPPRIAPTPTGGHAPGSQAEQSPSAAGGQPPQLSVVPQTPQPAATPTLGEEIAQ